MARTKRQDALLNILQNATSPVPGSKLAEDLGVTRPVIVQDIAMLRATNIDIISTNRGYVLQEPASTTRVFKTFHTDEELEEEFQIIIDLGGRIKDVFVYHKAYGVLRATLNIRSRFDIKKYLESISSGKSNSLENVTSGFHYHTVDADTEEQLDMIEEALRERGFLAKLQEYEPVNFWE